jgi:hypothetical protein
MKPPKHDRLIQGPSGVDGHGRCIGAIIHTTEMAPRKGTDSDRHDIVRFLSGKGKSVPVVADPGGGSTIMVPLGHLGSAHALGLTGKAWGIEQVGFAHWPRAEWMKPGKRKMVATSAAWAAWVLAELMDLPVTEKNLKRFIVGHDKDHKLGGSSDHTDPGSGYPWKLFREEAIAFARGRHEEGDVQFRVVATKGDERRAKTFRVKLGKRGLAWIQKQAKLGFNVVVRKKVAHTEPQP